MHQPTQISYTLPAEWEWVLDLFDQAHLPKLGLPVKWPATVEEHTRIFVDPTTGESFSIDTGKRLSSSPIGFIKASRGKHCMPGTDTPASARFERYYEPELHASFLKDHHNQSLIPCMAHGDYVKVESLQADHFQAKENIRKRQNELVAYLNKDDQFANHIIQQSGMNKFFVNYNGKYYGTLFFYELYFNDIDNLWLICGACNLHKSNQDTIAWLEDQWLYGQEFLDYLGKITQQKKQGILDKTDNNIGLATVAIEWFWKRHANYISTAKKLYEDVVIRIQLLNKQIDHIIGFGKKVRAERLQASLNVRLMFAAKLVQAGIGMPKGDNESQHSSSDEEARMTILLDSDGEEIPVSPGIYLRTAKEFGEEAIQHIADDFRNKLKSQAQLKQSAPTLVNN